MKQLSFLLLLFFNHAALSTNENVSFSNLTSSLNARGIPVYMLNGQPFTGTTYDEDAVEEICTEYTIVNGAIQRQQGWYFTGEKERDLSYQDGQMHGSCFMYYQNGQVYSEEFYISGNPDGRHFWYNCDGSLQREMDYVNGFVLLKLDYEKTCEKWKRKDGC